MVVPIYNEEESIPRLYASIRKACEGVGQNYEIIFIDDGSRDESFSQLEALHREDPHVKVILLGEIIIFTHARKMKDYTIDTFLK